jgi:hypothetical protein
MRARVGNSHQLGAASDATPPALKFVMEPSQPLPTDELSRTLASMWLPRTRYPQAVRLMRTKYALLTLCSKLAGVVFVVVLFVPHREVHIASAFLSVAALPSLVSIAPFFSLDICVLLLRNYEYWFMSMLNAMNMTTVVVIFGDIRALNCLGMWCAVQLIITMDASCRSSKFTTSFAAMSVPVVLAVAVACSYRLIHRANYFVIDIPGLPVHGTNIAAFASTTLAVFLAKKAVVTYRTRQTQLSPGRAVPCALLTARLRLVRVDDVDGGRTEFNLPTLFVVQPKLTNRSAATAQLRQSIPPCVVINSSQYLLASMRTASKLTTLWAATALKSAGVIGVVLTVAAWTIIMWCPECVRLAYAVGIPALASTTCFATVLGCWHCNRSLVKLEMTSFDLIFSSFQYHALVLCLCDIMQWRLHLCLPVASWWL